MATYGTSKPATTRVVSGLFRDGEQAERAYQSLLDLGYDRDEITVVMSDETHTRYGTTGQSATLEHGTKAAEGAGIGGAIGAAAGALFGAIAAIGTSLVVPGLGYSSPGRWPLDWRAQGRAASQAD
jgi:hypothetical protein